MPLKKPISLKKNDTIRIVASSSPFDKAAFLKGVSYLENLGFKIKYQKNIFHRVPYLAGTDQRRASELIKALNDDKTDAILFARGGYGSMRLLPYLDKIKIPKKPKIVLGYSDVTSLLAYISKRFKWSCFYGPGVAGDLHNKVPKKTRDSLVKSLTSNKPLGTKKFSKSVVINPGTATAPLAGGCLSLISTLLGTRYDINTAGKILFLEDVGEAPYVIDRMLTHLKLAGKLDHCKGLVFGSLVGPNPFAHYLETVRGFAKDLKIPVLVGIDVGHRKIKESIPLGVKTKLDTKNKSLTFLERALS